MRTLKDYAKYLLAQGRLFWGFLAYAFLGKNSDETMRALVTTYCHDGGITLGFYKRLMRSAHRPYGIKQARGLFGDLDPAALDKIQHELETAGYSMAEVLVPEVICRKLEELTARLVSKPFKTDPDLPRPPDMVFDPENLVSSRYSYMSDSLAQEEVVQDVMADPSLLAISERYFRAAPIIDSVILTMSTAFSKEANSEAAQIFHFDMDRLQWLKFFLYLSDVDENNGPHVFVEGSHRSGALPRPLRKRGYLRILDEEVDRLFPKEKIKVFNCRRGTLFVEDTRGIHKGTVLKKGSRLLFQIQYNLGLFGPEYLKRHEVEKLKSLRLKEMKALYPKVYSNFHFKDETTTR